MPRGPVTAYEMDLVQNQLMHGKKNAQSARSIAETTNLRSDKTDTRIRTIITELIMTLNIPVGSCSKGFYIVIEEAELEEVLRNLRKRMAGMNARLQKIRRNFETA